MTGSVLYDSNDIGKWNDGTAKTVKTFDDRFPKPFVNGKGFEMHASGDPRLILDGSGVGKLEADGGHGRLYIDSANYKAVTEYELRFDDDNIDNHTCQTQSRHQEGGEGPNRFGGISHMIDRKKKKCGSKVEKFHNEHIRGPEPDLPKDIDIGKWVKVRLTDIPNEEKKSISSKMEIDFNDGKGFVKCVEEEYKGLEDYMVDESSFNERSYTWFRVNNTKTGSISIRNIRQTSI